MALRRRRARRRARRPPGREAEGPARATWRWSASTCSAPQIFDAARAIEPSGRGELEITDAIQRLIDDGASRSRATRSSGWWKDTGQLDGHAGGEPARARGHRARASTASSIDSTRSRAGSRSRPAPSSSARVVRGPAIIGAGAADHRRLHRPVHVDRPRRRDHRAPRSSTRSCSRGPASATSTSRMEASLLGRNVKLTRGDGAAEDPADDRRRQLGDQDPVRILVTGAARDARRGTWSRRVARAATRSSRSPAPSSTSPTRPRSRTRSPSCRPDAVVNCAAFTDVDGAEDARARPRCRSTTTAAALLAAGGGSVGAKIAAPLERLRLRRLQGASPYVESDLPAALSAYGRSKQAGETSVAVANPRHFIVRSSWLFGTRRQELRRDDAAARRRAARGAGRLRPGRPPDLHAAPRRGARAADRGRRVRHPPRRRPRGSARGSSSRRRSSTRPGSSAG